MVDWYDLSFEEVAQLESNIMSKSINVVKCLRQVCRDLEDEWVRRHTLLTLTTLKHFDYFIPFPDAPLILHSPLSFDNSSVD